MLDVIITCTRADAKSFMDKWSEQFMQHFSNVSEHAGGERQLDVEVLLASFNYIDLDDIVKVAEGHTWLHPTQVSIFVKRAGELRMSAYELRMPLP